MQEDVEIQICLTSTDKFEFTYKYLSQTSDKVVDKSNKEYTRENEISRFQDYKERETKNTSETQRHIFESDIHLSQKII